MKSSEYNEESKLLNNCLKCAIFEGAPFPTCMYSFINSEFSECQKKVDRHFPKVEEQSDAAHNHVLSDVTESETETSTCSGCAGWTRDKNKLNNKNGVCVYLKHSDFISIELDTGWEGGYVDYIETNESFYCKEFKPVQDFENVR